MYFDRFNDFLSSHYRPISLSRVSGLMGQARDPGLTERYLGGVADPELPLPDPEPLPREEPDPELPFP